MNEMTKQLGFTVIYTAQGQLIANVIKAHLESEGIPVLLEYQSAGVVYGVAVNGLGEVKILVPEKFAEEAKHIIEPKDFGQA